MPLFLRMQAMALQPPVLSKEWKHDQEARSGSNRHGQSVSGDDVILACGERVTVMAEFGISVIAMYLQLKCD